MEHLIELIDVGLRRGRKYCYPNFTRSDQFTENAWWHSDEDCDDTSARWISVQREGEEVARCKIVLRDGRRLVNVPGDSPHGQLDVLAFEVAVSARRQGIGRATLRALKGLYPERRMTALNDNSESRKFWDGLGWIRHGREGLLKDVERVTYSEN